MTSSPAIRPYRSEDRETLDDICIRTAHNGQDSRPVYADPTIFPTIFAAPYVVLEPELAFVLDDGRGRAVGYILGTADTPRFVEAFRTKWLPLVADRHPELIRRIAAAGHEIASHGYGHDLVYELTQDQFRDDVGRSKRADHAAAA